MEFVMQAYNLGPAITVFSVAILLDLLLKGFALWRAANMGQRWWFIALFLFNTVGILPAVYLLMTSNEYAQWKAHKQEESIQKCYW